MKQQTTPVIRRHRPALVQLHQERARRCEASKQWRRAEYEWSRVIENCGTEEDRSVQLNAAMPVQSTAVRRMALSIRVWISKLAWRPFSERNIWR